jgi:hypothetical protein
MTYGPRVACPCCGAAIPDPSPQVNGGEARLECPSCRGRPRVTAAVVGGDGR